VSTASEPELQKNTSSRSPGAISARREASVNAFGCANWKGGAEAVGAGHGSS
jgi:hypothetical protein